MENGNNLDLPDKGDICEIVPIIQKSNHKRQTIKHNTIPNRTYIRNIIYKYINIGCTNSDTRRTLCRIAMQIYILQNSLNVTCIFIFRNCSLYREFREDSKIYINNQKHFESILQSLQTIRRCLHIESNFKV